MNTHVSVADATSNVYDILGNVDGFSLVRKWFWDSYEAIKSARINNNNNDDNETFMDSFMYITTDFKSRCNKSSSLSESQKNEINEYVELIKHWAYNK